MAEVTRRYSKEEFARRGDEVYARAVKPHLKPSDKGKFVAVDIETGEYAVSKGELAACHRLRKRVPDAQIWLVRAGYRYVHSFGGRDLQEVE